MSENKKFTEDELAKIVELREANAKKITEFGQIELEILLANQRFEALQDAKENMQKDYIGLQEDEEQLIKDLNDKYGAGTVDIASGEFIPAN
tara:strand:+ start:1930 stop:2205 length:276 start_codon:yes stop_codon:yes gene_type:complete